jgi:hypothetical protein
MAFSNISIPHPGFLWLFLSLELILKILKIAELDEYLLSTNLPVFEVARKNFREYD